MTITQKTEGDLIILAVEGRVDTTTSPRLQAEMLKVFQANEGLELDFSSVVYLSSAGLRALLIGQKTAAAKQLPFALRGVTAPVRKILESVGFHKILTLKP